MIKKLNYFWRLFATGFSFASFGIGGLFLGIFVFPPIVLLPLSPAFKKKAIRRIISLSFRYFMAQMHYLGVIDFQKKNIELLLNEKSCLIISNHPTLIDVVSIVAYCPNASCIVKEGVWKNPFMRGVVRPAGFIPNTNHHDLITKAHESIEGGDVLVIFPEGTRTRPGKPLEFQRGAAQIILAANCNVRKLKITCDPITLTKGLPWYKIPEKRAVFTLEVLDKNDPCDSEIKAMPRPKAARVLTQNFLDFYHDSILQ